MAEYDFNKRQKRVLEKKYLIRKKKVFAYTQQFPSF